VRDDDEPAHSAAELLGYYYSDAELIFPDGPAPLFETDVRLFGVGGLRGWRNPGRVLFRSAEIAGRYARGDSVARRGGPKTRYSAKGLDTVLDRYVGDRHLTAALTDLIVPSWDVSRKQPVLFSSRGRPELISDARMREVARATSAAPTYFPPLVFPITDGPDRILVDGGLYANNPTLIGYLEGVSLARDAGRPLVLVSLGTGRPREDIPMTAADWKGRSWWGVMQAIFEATMTGSAIISDRLLATVDRQDAGLQYWRLQMQLDDCSSAMDDPRPENIACLRTLAETYAEEQRPVFDEICSALT
jgi:predicted acylesterase/phospholipase RssA